MFVSRHSGGDARIAVLNLWASVPIFVRECWWRSNSRGECTLGLDRRWRSSRADLERIGGFRSIVDFLADDYELGRRIADLGLKVVLSEEVVETHVPAYDLRGYLAHQMRWSRGVRDARLGGYIGLVTTFGILWALLNVVAAHAAPWSWVVLGFVLLLCAGPLQWWSERRCCGDRSCLWWAMVVALAGSDGCRGLDRELCRTHGHVAWRSFSLEEWATDAARVGKLLVVRSFSLRERSEGPAQLAMKLQRSFAINSLDECSH